jgi:hypothetical protein
MKFTSFILPLVLYKCPSTEFDVRDFSFQRWLTYDLNFFCEISWELRKEAENEGIFLGRFDNIVLIVTVKFQFCIFEATRIDFRRIFKDKLQIDC